MEASMEGINAIGFSLLDFSEDADFSQCRDYVKAIIEYVLENGMQNGNLLNVNIPKLPATEIKGIKICRQADAKWEEVFEEKKDPMGQPYYWLTGKFANFDERSDIDIKALEEGYISVVPAMHDLTNQAAMEPLKPMEKIEM